MQRRFGKLVVRRLVDHVHRDLDDRDVELFRQAVQLLGGLGGGAAQPLDQNALGELDSGGGCPLAPQLLEFRLQAGERPGQLPPPLVARRFCYRLHTHQAP
jgi:hypothetical protein